MVDDTRLEAKMLFLSIFEKIKMRWSINEFSDVLILEILLSVAFFILCRFDKGKIRENLCTAQRKLQLQLKA